MTKLETEFTQALLQALERAQALTGIPETRLARAAQRYGGAAAVKELLRRGQSSGQFAALAARRRLDLSPEWLATQGRFSPLFTDEEADMCLAALLAAGAFSL